jgi:GNAT superfamily N-acetyltransferase
VSRSADRSGDVIDADGTPMRQSGMEVARSRPEDRPALAAFLELNNALRAARRGELVDCLAHPALVAWSDGELVGAATYVVENDDCELLTLHARARFTGVGTALVAGVQGVARGAGCTRLWLVTTNDNVDALRFYQRRGFRLARLSPGAVDRSRRTLKPGIPTTGAYGIPLRDELELEMPLLHTGSDDVRT